MRAPHLALIGLIVLGLASASCDGRRDRRRTDAGPPAGDAGATDAGVPLDGAPPADAAVDRDGGPRTDAGGTLLDAGPADAGPGPFDAGTRDAGPVPVDAGPPDAGPPDAGPSGDRIESIQRGLIAEGTAVTVRNVVVTGVYYAGLWVQDPAVAGAYAGVRVYLGTSPAVAVGDRVDVSGTVLEYFGDTEIDGAVVTRLGSGTPIAPRAVTVAQAATEPWEGVLVRLTDVATTTTSYDCSVDSPSCADPNLWLASSTTAAVVVWDFLYQDADWLSRVGSTSVVGVASWRYDRRRILPRFATDLAP